MSQHPSLIIDQSPSLQLESHHLEANLKVESLLPEVFPQQEEAPVALKLQHKLSYPQPDLLRLQQLLMTMTKWFSTNSWKMMKTNNWLSRCKMKCTATEASNQMLNLWDSVADSAATAAESQLDRLTNSKRSLYLMIPWIIVQGKIKDSLGGRCRCLNHQLMCPNQANSLNQMIWTWEEEWEIAIR